MPATNVPCPRPSPGELGRVVVNTFSAMTRVPMSKSARFLSMPESTIAIVGIVARNCSVWLKKGRMFSAVGQSCLEVGMTVPANSNSASLEIVSPWYFLASSSTLPAFSVTAIEFTNLN